jgi:hypothetical protein
MTPEERRFWVKMGRSESEIPLCNPKAGERRKLTAVLPAQHGPTKKRYGSRGELLTLEVQVAIIKGNLFFDGSYSNLYEWKEVNPATGKLSNAVYRGYPVFTSV